MKSSVGLTLLSNLNTLMTIMMTVMEFRGEPTPLCGKRWMQKVFIFEVLLFKYRHGNSLKVRADDVDSG